MAEANTLLDTYNLDSDRKLFAATLQMQCEMRERILSTKEMIADTRAMIAQAERIFAAK